MRPKFRKPTEHKFEKIKEKTRAYSYGFFKCEKCGLHVNKIPSDLGKCPKVDLTMDEEMIESIIS